MAPYASLEIVMHAAFELRTNDPQSAKLTRDEEASTACLPQLRGSLKKQRTKERQLHERPSCEALLLADREQPLEFVPVWFVPL